MSLSLQCFPDGIGGDSLRDRNYFRMGQKMKKSFIASILLFGFIGCDGTPSPVTIQNEQNASRTPEPAGNDSPIQTETTAEHLSFIFGPPSLPTIKVKPQETVKPDETEKPEMTFKSDAIEKPEESAGLNKTEKSQETIRTIPIKYMSRKDGFNVLLPSDPTVMNMDATKTTHVRIYQTQAYNGLIQYNVFYHFFEKKIVNPESIRAHLDSYLPDRLVGVDKGQIIRKSLITFRGFDAKEFEYISAEGDAEFLYKGIVFLIDGDSISLTMVYPKESTPELTFDEFTESFELLPLEPVLSINNWKDERLRIRFTPPADMFVLNREREFNGLIVMFANQSGHTIGILDATVAYPGITWSDINTQLSKMKDCGDGFYENIIAGTSTKPPTIQLLRCASNGERIYLIQAYAPQKSYFRSVQIFKAAMKSFSFDN